MYAKYKVKCCNCNNTVITIYDSRSKGFKMSDTCPCGKLKVSAYSHGYNYNKGANIELISSEIKALKEDYLVLSPGMKDLYNLIKEKAEKLGFEEYKQIDNVDGESQIRHLDLYADNNFNNDTESIGIQFELHLHQDTGWADWEIEKVHKNIMQRLIEFNKFLDKALDDNSIVKRPDYLWDTNELDFQGERTQIKKYDYNFYF